MTPHVDPGKPENPGAEKERRSRRRLLRRRPRRMWSGKIAEDYPEYNELIERATQMQMKRYRRFGILHMWWFRGFGLVEIVLSIAFPFVVVMLPEWTTAADASTNTAVLTGISVLIALTAAVHGFFGWNDNWRLYRNQELALLLIIRRWELDLLSLSLQKPTDNDGKIAAWAATRAAIDEVNRALEHEQDVFFGTVRLPEDLLKKDDHARHSLPARQPPAEST